MRIDRAILALALLTALTGKGGAVTLELISPSESVSEVVTPTINVAVRLGDYDRNTTYSAMIGETTVPVFSTGIAVRDFVPVALGANKISVSVVGHGSQTSKSLTVTRKESLPRPAIRPTARKLWPESNTQLPAGDTVKVGFDEVAGGQGEVRWGGEWLPLIEEPDAATSRSIYRGHVVISETSSSSVEMRFRPKTGDAWKTMESKGKVSMLSANARRMVKAKSDLTPVSYGLTDVRLGGPFLSEVSSNTIFQVTGQVGSNLRVALGESSFGWVPIQSTVPLPSHYPKPHLEFTGISTTVTASGDEMLAVAYPEAAPYAVSDVVSPDGQPEVHIDFFGAHPAATWISHNPELEIIRQILIEQPSPGVVRLRVLLIAPILWGYRTEIADGSFRVYIRNAPQYDVASPLKGLKVAIEAGHGGTDNGARGMAGTREKDVNRQVSDALVKQLIAAGATVIQTRVGDTNPGRPERAYRAIAADADFYISIHCNSAGHHRGYLGVNGNCMLYKQPFNHRLSELMHKTIMKETGLGTFGVVSNFNYTPIRINSWMPSVLVEQAFISNPEEEALFNDSQYHENMARGIMRGIESYLTETGSR